MILIASDLHLQTGAWADRPIRGDAAYALQQIIELCTAKQTIMTAVVLPGDLLDKQVNRSYPVITLQRGVRKLRELMAGHVYFIEGQHELDNPAWLTGAATHLNGQLVRIPGRNGKPGVSLSGFGYQTQAKLASRLLDVPVEADIVVMHQVWGEWMGARAQPQGWLKDVPGHISAVWTGDLHQYRLEHIERPQCPPLLALSPGATCQQSISEPDEHFVVLYDPAIDPGRTEAYTQIQLRSRPRLTVDMCFGVEEAAVLDDAVAAVPEQVRALTDPTLPESIQAPLVWLHYSPDTGSPEAMVRKALKDAGLTAHVFGKQKGSSPVVLPFCDGLSDEERTPVTLASVIDEVFPADVAPLERDLAFRLQSGEDPGETVVAWCEDFEQLDAGKDGLQ